MKLIRAYLACKGGVLPCSQKCTRTKIHPVPRPFLPTLPTPNLNHSNQLQAHQWMWRQNVASQENVASPNNVAPNNVAPKCGVTGKCGVAKQCGAKQCGAKMWRHRKMWRHQTMWRQTMQRQNVASQENVASPNNVAPNNVAPHVFEMCLHNVSSASGGKVRALLPTPWISWLLAPCSLVQSRQVVCHAVFV